MIYGRWLRPRPVRSCGYSRRSRPLSRKHPSLTTDAALLHMAHWSTADVFLAGHSSFSSIPALLNPNCVMAPMYTPNSAKRACVARVARARAAELSRA